MAIGRVSIPVLSPRLRSKAWAVLLLLALLNPARAGEELKPEALPQAQATLEPLQREIAIADTATAWQLKALRKEISAVRSSALDCVQQTESQVALLDSQLAVLQPETPRDVETKTSGKAASAVQPAAPVSPVIARQLENLQSRKASLEARHLLTRGATLPEVLRANLDERQRWLDLFDRGALAVTGRDPGLAYPSVLFVGFGDSSLDFELRVIIRDINRRRYVTSDLNRAINAAFIEKGIEIPFPQRDVNFRGPLQVEPGASALPVYPGDEPSQKS